MQAAQWCTISDASSPLHPHSGNVSGEYGLFSFVKKYDSFFLFFTPLWKRDNFILWEHSSCLTAASSAPRAQHVWRDAVLLTSAGKLPLLAAPDQREFKLAIWLAPGFGPAPLAAHAACMKVSTRATPLLSLNLGKYDKMARNTLAVVLLQAKPSHYFCYFKLNKSTKSWLCLRVGRGVQRRDPSVARASLYKQGNFSSALE